MLVQYILQFQRLILGANNSVYMYVCDTTTLDGNQSKVLRVINKLSILMVFYFNLNNNKSWLT